MLITIVEPSNTTLPPQIYWNHMRADIDWALTKFMSEQNPNLGCKFYTESPSYSAWVIPFYTPLVEIGPISKRVSLPPFQKVVLKHCGWGEVPAREYLANLIDFPVEEQAFSPLYRNEIQRVEKKLHDSFDY